jgi:hypothetical protein
MGSVIGDGVSCSSDTGNSVFFLKMPLDGFGDCIGTGENLPLAIPNGGMTTDPLELPYDF